jgi:hypothetical protein
MFLSNYLDFNLLLPSHKCFTSIIILIILLLPEGQAGKPWKRETKQCSSGYEVALARKTPSGCFYKFVVSPVFQINADTVSKFEVATARFSCSTLYLSSPKSNTLLCRPLNHITINCLLCTNICTNKYRKFILNYSDMFRC